MVSGSLLIATAPIGRRLGEAEPDIGEHDDDERRQVQEHDEPGIGDPVEIEERPMA